MKKIIGTPGEYLHLIVGNLLFALGFDLFLAGNDIAAGGFGGLGLVVSRLIPVSVGTVVFVLSIPVFIWSFKVEGAKYTLSALISTVAFSAFTDALSFLPTLTNNKLMAAVCGGILYGLAAFVLVRGRVSGSGSDLLGRLLVTKYRVLSLGTFVFIVDVVVILLSAITFKEFDSAIYAGISVFCCSYVTDFAINGLNKAYMFQIITTADADLLSEKINDRIGRGSTLVAARGMYSKQERNMIICVVSFRQVYDMKDVIRRYAPDAFVVLLSANEIMGEGFTGLDVTVPIKDLEEEK